MILAVLCICVALSGAGAASPLNWPGGSEVTNADETDEFPTNLSGLYIERGDNATTLETMYAVVNDPSTLYKLKWSGKNWLPVPHDGWRNGKTLHFPDGKGNPDTEDLTMTADGSGQIYVCSERDNDDTLGNKRVSILLYDTTGSSTSLSAKLEWILMDLEKITTSAEDSIEAITWIPDKFLVSNGFIDQSTHTLYDPSRHPNHGDGLFFVGLEENGNVYAYALNHADSSATQIAAFSSGETQIMSLYFDRDSGYLWAECDNHCEGRTNVLALAGEGRGSFANLATFNRPSAMPNFNNEGFAVAPDALCAGGQKPVYWADDDHDGGHSIYQGSIPCGQFLE